MNIILGKDGKLSVNESPLQGKAADLDNLAAFISNPSDGDAIVYDADAGIWKAGASGGGGLPSVTAVDNGKVLTVEEGAWAAANPSGGGGALVVTLTRNGSDLVADKTWKEISDAASTMPVVCYVQFGADTKCQGLVPLVSSMDGGYSVNVLLWMGAEWSQITLGAESENDYPEGAIS